MRTSLATRRGAQIFGPPRTPVLQAAVMAWVNDPGSIRKLYTSVATLLATKAETFQQKVVHHIRYYSQMNVS